MIHHLLLQATNAAATAVKVVADTTKAIAGQAPAGTEDKMSLLDLVIKGGVIMIPLGILSLISFYIIIERYIVIKKASQTNKNFLDSLRDMLHGGNIEGAKALCKGADNPISRVIGKGITKMGMPFKDVEDSMENAGRLEVYQLEKNLSILGIIAGIAPMFGFIGTILGVIKIFYNISLANNISIGLIAGGLYEKMITSATGLSIGIFSFVAFHWLNIMVNKNIQKIEIASIDFLDTLHEAQPK